MTCRQEEKKSSKIEGLYFTAKSRIYLNKITCDVEKEGWGGMYLMPKGRGEKKKYKGRMMLGRHRLSESLFQEGIGHSEE